MIHDFSPAQSARLEESYQTVLTKLKLVPDGNIRNEDSPAKVEVRRKILGDESFRGKFEAKMLGNSVCDGQL